MTKQHTREEIIETITKYLRDEVGAPFENAVTPSDRFESLDEGEMDEFRGSMEYEYNLGGMDMFIDQSNSIGEMADWIMDQLKGERQCK